MLSRHARTAGWVFLVLGSCATPKTRVDRESVTREIHERADIAPHAHDQSTLPPGVDLANGVSREEAIAVSLWRNLELAASLAELDVARATVFDAGLLRDPVFSLLFPLGPKQLEATLQLPLDALWMRTERIELAEADAERLAAELVRHGVDLVNAVQRDFNDLEKASTDAAIASEILRVAREIARLDELRGEVGEIARGTARDSRLSAQIAEESFKQAEERVRTAQRALAARMGLDGIDALHAEAAAGPSDVETIPEPQTSLIMALACRPDLRAAELAVEVAAKRLGLTREEAWQVTAIIDANETAGGRLDVGPGLSTSLPIFRGSRGTHAIAAAQLEVASARYRSVRARAALEVQGAGAALREAVRAFVEWRDRIGPQARASLETARRAHAAGDTSAIEVLRGELRTLELAQREVHARWQMRQARAELERAVGRRNLGTGNLP